MDELATSSLSFADGSRWKVEIPSVEGPEALAAVLDEAERRDVPVHRVSQGSGISMLLDDELQEMLAIAAERAVEVVLFVGPRGAFDIGASAVSPDGAALGAALRGRRQLDAAMHDVDRAVALGLRGILVGDIGFLALLGARRAAGELPADLRIKVSALGAPANPASAQVMVDLGADTLNVHSDHTMREMSEFRAGVGVPLDLYVEAPDGLGGIVRYHEISEFVRVAAPVHLKFGLRNAAGIYPAGRHLRELMVAGARERVRRAQLGLEHLVRGDAARSARAGTPATIRG